MSESLTAIQARAADIRLLVLDVDGVLTDGRIHMTARGEETKVFHVRDGAGIAQVLRAGLQVAVISGRDSPAVDKRMAELGVTFVRQGVADKLATLHELLSILNLGPQATASIGDDSAEVPLLQASRLGVAVADAHASAKAAAHWITQANGGQGAVRELCDLILAARGGVNA
ncbi:MAG TPA: HAD hydrolase family protein [Steroidobacteraceae bacterium]|nr:HAD hydrolase family protein [Steroidobacteraceae bacterium]